MKPLIHKEKTSKLSLDASKQERLERGRRGGEKTAYIKVRREDSEGGKEVQGGRVGGGEKEIGREKILVVKIPGSAQFRGGGSFLRESFSSS